MFYPSLVCTCVLTPLWCYKARNQVLYERGMWNEIKEIAPPTVQQLLQTLLRLAQIT